MVILTVSLKEVIDERMPNGRVIAPDFGDATVKSWGKCSEMAPKGFMTVWVDCDEQNKAILKKRKDFQAEFSGAKGDAALIETCKQLLK